VRKNKLAWKELKWRKDKGINTETKCSVHKIVEKLFRGLSNHDFNCRNINGCEG